MKSYLARMEELRDGHSDPETAHYEADCILLEIVRAFEYEDVADAFDQIKKWYA